LGELSRVLPALASDAASARRRANLLQRENARLLRRIAELQNGLAAKRPQFRDESLRGQE
jgi:hypothetical protein